MLRDPQTSGGLLVAAPPETAEPLLRHVNAAGFARATVIGTMTAEAVAVEIM